MSILPGPDKRKAALFFYSVNLLALLLCTGQLDRPGGAIFATALGALVTIFAAANGWDHWSRGRTAQATGMDPWG